MREKFSSVRVKHGALQGGGCTACHDPHGSGQKFMLKGNSMSETCTACHENVAGGAVPHKPARQSCVLCHEPHGGENGKLLTQEQPKLCFDCHQEMRGVMNKKNIHKPAAAGCTGCHNPHSAPNASLLKADPQKGLCLGCHDDIAKHLKNVKRPHRALESGGCPACHTPHASDQGHLLIKPMKELCSSCHKEMKAELQSQFPHGPVKMSQCQGCHDPHGATNPNILKTFFPPGFYNPYKDGLYALCFNCHKKDIALDAKTTTLTDFRNGDENLHYTHVHSEKGRSCKACHQVHSSAQEKHVRADVPFGSWMLPINFRKTPNGGTCNVGCHNPKTYNRLTPVRNQ
jgi:predicted CXXCH cytochrome family protein